MENKNLKPHLVDSGLRSTDLTTSENIRLSENIVTRETFENTDSGRDVAYFESMDELLDSLDS